MIEDENAQQEQPEGEAANHQPEQNASEPGTEQPAENTSAEQPEKKGGENEPEEPKKRPWFMERIDRQGAKIAEYQRQLQEYQRREQEAQRRQQSPEQDQSQDGDRRQPQNFNNDEVERRAAQIAEQRDYANRAQEWDRKGVAEFPDFRQRCEHLAHMGAGDRPEFMQIILGLADGHKITAHLADHPDEATRILSLPGHSMAYELGRLSSTGLAPKARPTSAAPPPIRPLAGSGKVETDPNKMSIDEWMRWRDKQSSA